MPNVFQVFRSGTVPRRYTNALKERIRQDPALQFLPALLDLPLLPSGAVHTHVATLLMNGPFVALQGPMGSGRSLALQQIAWHWTLSSREYAVVTLSLARPDVIQANPYAVLEQAFHETGLPVRPHADAAQPGQSWLLLVDDWESLPQHLQAEWRDTLLTLPQFWPTARWVVVLPEACEPWPGLQTIKLSPPDDPMVLTWLNHLRPAHEAESLFNALKRNTAQTIFHERLLDIALLAFIDVRTTLPSSRFQLYDRALTHIREAGYDLRVRTSALHPTVGSDAFRCYEMAQQFAATHDIAPMMDLSMEQRIESARIVAGMPNSVNPLFAALWMADQPTPENILILGQCLTERVTESPKWWIRVLRALAHHTASEPHQHVLHDLATQVPDIFGAAHNTLPEEPTRELLIELASVFGGPSLISLVDNTLLSAPIRWAATDALTQLPTEIVRTAVHTAKPPDTLSQASRLALLAFSGPNAWNGLPEPVLLSWINALQEVEVAQQRRMQLFHTLLNDERVPAAVRAAVLAVTRDMDESGMFATLAQACLDQDASVRQHALLVLRNYDAQQTLVMLGRIVLSGDVAWEVRYDVLKELAQYHHSDAVTLLARCLVAPDLPLAGRLQALDLLSLRRGPGPVILRRMLPVESVPPLLRAYGAQLLGRLEATQAIADLRQVALSAAPSHVKQGAVEALGRLGRHHAQRAEVLSVIRTVLKRSFGDIPLTVCTIHALGVLGDVESVPTLCALLGSEATNRLKQIWLSHANQLAEVPVNKWAEVDLPTQIRIVVLTTLAEGLTNADHPGDFDELIAWQGARVSNAIASALAAIAKTVGGDVQETIRKTLLEKIQGMSHSEEVRHMLECLMEIGEESGVSDLESLLLDSTLNPTLRWLAVAQLGQRSTTIDKLLDYLKWNLLDPFTSSKTVEVLGQYRPIRALSTLRRLADQSNHNLHLRFQAIAALGLLDDPAAETALYHIVSDVSDTGSIRAAAAVALGSLPQPETGDQLRALLQRERNSEVVCGLLQALGQMQDRTSLPQMLQYVHHHDASVVLAALDSIVWIGDDNVTPILIQVAQKAMLDQRVRLHAIGILLQLCGDEHLPLLMSYLDSGTLALRLQAFDYLLALQPNTPYIHRFLNDRAVPLALRLRAIAAAEHSQDQTILIALLLCENDNEQLRAEAATALGRIGNGQAIDALHRCVQEATTPLRVRYHCITALAALAHASRPHAARALFALSQIADHPDQLDENRAWASHALVSAIGT